jgi:hypothetical protein
VSPQALYITPGEGASGVVLDVDLPSGPATVRIPPVWGGSLLRIGTPHGDVFFRVRVVRTLGGRLKQALIAASVLLVAMVGPSFIIAGATWHPDPASTPTCDGEQMDFTDVCVKTTYVNGSKNVSYLSYLQMQAEDNNPDHGSIAAGVVITVIEGVIGAGAAVGYLVWRRRPLSLSAVPVPVTAGDD